MPRSASTPARERPALGIDERRRLIRRLIAEEGRGLAEAYGFPVTNNPSRLFALLYLSMLTAGRRPVRAAAGLAEAVHSEWDSAGRMATVQPERIADVLRRAGAGSTAAKLAGTLSALARQVATEYHGDLRRLRQQAARQQAARQQAARQQAARQQAARQQAAREPTTVRRMLTRLPGIDDRTVDLFFREVQMVWPEVGPFADRRTLAAAARLGLGGRLDDLTALTGGAPRRGRAEKGRAEKGRAEKGRAEKGNSEKLAWLAGALTIVDEENRYAHARTLAHA
ncbi:MAG: hypothetical protein J2P15_17940 [Micromonosporaceae bacterium]|nr:hypothetical protein [Micromonosporaceae bacterium]